MRISRLNRNGFQVAAFTGVNARRGRDKVKRRTNPPEMERSNHHTVCLCCLNTASSSENVALNGPLTTYEGPFLETHPSVAMELNRPVVESWFEPVELEGVITFVWYEKAATW